MLLLSLFGPFRLWCWANAMGRAGRDRRSRLSRCLATFRCRWTATVLNGSLMLWVMSMVLALLIRRVFPSQRLLPAWLVSAAASRSTTNILSPQGLYNETTLAFSMELINSSTLRLRLWSLILILRD